MDAKSIKVCLTLVAALVLSAPAWAVEEQAARSDTTWFGRYSVVGDDYYAVASASKSDAVWNFDRGIGPMGDPDRIDGGEGWAAINLTSFDRVLFRILDADLDLGPGVAPPLLEGAASLWVGASAPEANEYGYQCLAGYGNGWRQLAISEPLAYSGSGTVQLSFLYFQDSEPQYDGTQVYLQRANGSRLLLNPSATPNLGFNGRIGIDGQGSITPASYGRTITQSEIGAAQQIRVVLEFRSDAIYSDEDCEYPTPKGPFAADRVRVLGGGIDRTWGFEDGAAGWTFDFVIRVPDDAGIADFSCYGASLECLSDNVLEAHADTCTQGYHPVDQMLRLESPVCELGADWQEAFLEYDAYWETAEYHPGAWRLGWRYYPAPGALGDRWSDRVGSATWLTPGGTQCLLGGRTNASPFVPSSARQVKAVIEIAGYLTELDGINPGPLFDNLVVGAVGAPDPAGLGLIADDAGRGLVASPNPSGAATSIRYRLARASEVRLEVLDVSGRLIRTLEGGPRPAGSRSVIWDGADGQGHGVGAGVYWVRLRTDGAAESRKVVLTR